MYSQVNSTFDPTQLRLAISWVFCGAVPIIAGILVIIAQWNYFKYRNWSFAKKRYPSLVFVKNLSIACFLIIERPLSVIVHVISLQDSHLWLQLLRWSLFTIFINCAVFSFALKKYMFYFDVNWTKASNCGKWHHLITTSQSENGQKNWFLKYRSTWGNIHFVQKYTIIVFIIATLLPIILILINPNLIFLASILNNLMYFIFLIIILFSWHKTPVFHDEFLIRKEMKRSMSIMFLFFFWYLQFKIFNWLNMESFVSWLITSAGTAMLMVLLAYLPLIWVLKNYATSKERERMLSHENEDYRRPSTILNVDIIEILRTDDGFNEFMNHLAKEFSMENLLSITEMTQYKKRFRYILRLQEISTALAVDCDGFKEQKSGNVIKNVFSDIFNAVKIGRIADFNGDNDRAFSETINHSVIISAPDTKLCDDDIDDEKVEEIPVATALSVHDYLSVKKGRPPSKSLIDIRKELIFLPSTLPKSTIVYGLDFDENKDNESQKQYLISLDRKIEAQRMIKMLIEKYIEVNAEMELNLSYGVRKHMLKKYGRMTEMDDDALEHMFDQCMEHILKLMQDSYVRFQETPAFFHYKQKLKMKIVEIKNEKAVESALEAAGMI